MRRPARRSTSEVIARSVASSSTTRTCAAFSTATSIRINTLRNPGHDRSADARQPDPLQLAEKHAHVKTPDRRDADRPPRQEIPVGAEGRKEGDAKGAVLS